MASRRQRALALLERLSKHEIEGAATELGQLRARIAELERRRDQMHDDLAREAHIVSIEAAPYVGSYIRAVRAEIGAAEAARAKLTPRETVLEERVREGFREMKTFAAVAAREAARQRAAQQARETAEMEEQLLLRWGRDPH